VKPITVLLCPVLGRKIDNDVSAYSSNQIKTCQPSATFKACKSVYWIMSGVATHWITLYHTTQKPE
jgi:hypothetical protein